MTAEDGAGDGAPQVTEGTVGTDPDAAVVEALGRSAAYRLLSLMFLPAPGEPDGLAREHGDGLEALRAAVSSSGVLSPELVESVAHLSERTADGSLRDEYYRTFGHQISKDSPLYETQYGGGHIFQQAQQLADIAGFYRAFGLEVADGAGERVDHLGLELEFMQVLAYREAYARLHHGAEQVMLLRDAQQAFLRDHLSRWVPVLARLVRRRTEGIYRHLADLAAAWVAADARGLGLPPVETAQEMDYQPASALDPAGSLPMCGQAPESAQPRS